MPKAPTTTTTTSKRAGRSAKDVDGKLKKTTKTTKTKKDPNAPKRGLSAYMFFSQAHRKTVQEENPEAGFGQIGKILGDKWKAMDDNDKKPYNEKAETDKKRYEKEKKEQQGEQ